jgi:hypothetical protein
MTDKVIPDAQIEVPGRSGATSPEKNGGTGGNPPERHIRKIAGELGIAADQVEATARLLGEEATVPFIARYRKEVTGTLDEVQITELMPLRVPVTV